MSQSTTAKSQNCLNPDHFRQDLLTFYRQYGRNLPWRARHDAYTIWLSEVMLQQTTVTAVIPYYEKFLIAYPTVEALTKASEQEVFHLWQGLGYYSRARNLLKCAQTIVAEHGGHFPQTQKELETLPGIGPYTAAAITAMAFNQPASVLDGNVERAISRIYRIEAPLPKAKPELRTLAAELADPQHPRDYANAIMELGAVVCTPKNPSCATCPVTKHCASAGKGDAATFPRKAPKKAKPTSHGKVYIITNKNGEILLQQRPSTGLLANLWEAPSTDWRDATPLTPELSALIASSTPKPCGHIKHVFTHFTLTLEVYLIDGVGIHGKFFTQHALPPLPNLMKKVLGALSE